jgi:hypothetical protein
MFRPNSFVYPFLTLRNPSFQNTNLSLAVAKNVTGLNIYEYKKNRIASSIYDSTYA